MYSITETVCLEQILTGKKSYHYFVILNLISQVDGHNVPRPPPPSENFSYFLRFLLTFPVLVSGENKKKNCSIWAPGYFFTAIWNAGIHISAFWYSTGCCIFIKKGKQASGRIFLVFDVWPLNFCMQSYILGIFRDTI